MRPAEKKPFVVRLATGHGMRTLLTVVRTGQKVDKLNLKQAEENRAWDLAGSRNRFPQRRGR